MRGMSMDVEVFVEICRESAVLPSYAREGDAGMDVCAAEEVLIKPGETRVIPTGLKMAVPEGYEIQIRPRSGLSLNTPLRISNSPGTIDSGYRDEIGIIVTNTSESTGCETSNATESSSPGSTLKQGDGALISGSILTVESKGNISGTYIIRKGDRIAQMVLQRVPRMKLVPVKSIGGIGTDRGGGFGSTGIR